MVRDVIIIGGGPAGLSAGIYLSRAGWKTLLFDKDALGGQARRIERIENYPGFPRGIDGPALMKRFAAQAKRWKLETLKSAVSGVSRGPSGFRVNSGSGAYDARGVIACAGTVFKSLGLENEGGGLVGGIHHAAFEEAGRCAGRTVAVVGGGEAAVAQALLLSRRAKKVFLLHRGGILTAIPLLLSRLADRPNIEPLFHTVVKGVRGGAQALKSIEVEDTKTGRRALLEVSRLFVLIGKEPAPSLSGWRRPPPGYFVAGDSHAGRFRQVAIAAGDGVKAAMKCEGHLLLRKRCGS